MRVRERVVKRNPEGFRYCFGCKITKPLDRENFYRDKSRQGGFGYRCIECNSKRQWKNKPPGWWLSLPKPKKDAKKAAYRKNYRTPQGRVSSLWSRYRKIDAKKGHSCDLTHEWLWENVIDAACVYCGDDLEPVGLDRVDNSQGHLVANVVVCCPTCNWVRGDLFTFEEMKMLGKTIAEIKASRKLKS